MAFQRIPCVKAWSSTVLLGNTSHGSSCRYKEKRLGNGPRKGNKIQVMRIPVGIPRCINYPANHREPLEHRHDYFLWPCFREIFFVLSSGNPGEAKVAEKEKYFFVIHFHPTQGFARSVSST